MAADGSIIIETDIDDKKAQTELNKLNRKIQSINDKIYTKKQMQMPLVEESKRLGAELDAAKAKLDRMQSGREFNTAAAVKEQQQRVNELQKEWDNVEKKVDSYRKSIEEANISLDLTKQQVGAVQQQMAAIPPNGEKMAKAMEKAQKSAKRFGMRLKEVVRSALVFTLITQGLAMVRKWMGRVIKTNAEATAAIAKLKGALLTLAQPLLSVIIPAFTAFVNVLTKIVSVAAQLLSMLFGKTIEQSKDAAEGLHEETEALEGVGAAAEKASGSLAGFDEINTISTEKSGGGGAGSTEIAPNFDFGATMAEGKLKKILELVKLIGSALIAWRISKALGYGLKNFLLLLGSIYSALTFVQGAWDAWINGVSWGNFGQMLFGMVGMATTLGLLFGPVIAGISLVVTGLSMMVIGFKDAVENGLNLQNMLTILAGLLGTGIGISLLTGNWIPALLAGLAGALLAITYFFGDGEALIAALQKIFEGFSEFFGAVFSGDMEAAAAALKKIWEGIKEAALVVWDAIKNAAKALGKWLLEKADKLLVAWIRGCERFGQNLRNWWNNLWGKIKDAWNAVNNWFSEKIDSLVNWGKRIVENIKTGIASAWDGLKSWFNGLWDNLFGNRKVSATVSGKAVSPAVARVFSAGLPRLATGAVIPPNREFMAILGDQRSGNNIEAPEALIRKIVREEAGGMNTDLLQAILEAIRAGQVIKVNETVLGRTTAKAINKVTQSAGKAVLLY